MVTDGVPANWAPKHQGTIEQWTRQWSEPMLIWKPRLIVWGEIRPDTLARLRDCPVQQSLRWIFRGEEARPKYCRVK